ncbi:LysR substrate-binding domain-containing protein, partial [Acinetobacter baumannii]|uniref:LysR substrate-binding domain-containing protein n=1 Tax=Acinetobacter baumannii TaxID=470 RepID=UPI002244B968
LAGLGACVSSAWVVAQDIEEGRLVQLVPQWRAAPLPVYLIYPHARSYPAKLRLFAEIIRTAIQPRMSTDSLYALRSAAAGRARRVRQLRLGGCTGHRRRPAGPARAAVASR